MRACLGAVGLDNALEVVNVALRQVGPRACDERVRARGRRGGFTGRPREHAAQQLPQLAHRLPAFPVCIACDSPADDFPSLSSISPS